MTDEQIIETLKKADACLDQYIGIILPVAAELARRKSEAVFGNSTAYAGRLGCSEEGLNTLCLHNIDDNRTRDEEKNNKAFAFDDTWYEKARAAGIKNIIIQGYF